MRLTTQTDSTRSVIMSIFIVNNKSLFPIVNKNDYSVKFLYLLYQEYFPVYL